MSEERERTDAAAKDPEQAQASGDAATEGGGGMHTASAPERRGKAALLPLGLSLLALVLAAVALGMQARGGKPTAAPRIDVAARLQAVEARLQHLEARLASERRERMQARLDRLLAEMRDLSSLADAKAKREIGKAAAILSRLTAGPATRVKARVDLEHSKKRAAAAKERPDGKGAGAKGRKDGGGKASTGRDKPASGTDAAGGKAPAERRPEGKREQLRPAAG